MIYQATTAAEIYNQAFNAGLKPEPPLTVSEWADRYRTLSQRASAEPGPWRTSRTPYLRAIMDALSPSSPVERVVFMAGSQTGKTECGNNWIGFIIHQAPGPMMAVQPTVEMAKRNSKQRIDPLIEESKALKELVKEARSRDSGNTILAKEFPGGLLVMTGANSAVGLRSMAARYLFLDEVDAYPGDVENEGDPINLAAARTRTFARRKIFMVSTPKITGRSRIEAAFQESDQRRYWLPCPGCGEFQILKFDRLRWPKGEPEKAVYVCEHCDREIHNHEKHGMLARASGGRAQSAFHVQSASTCRACILQSAGSHGPMQPGSSSKPIRIRRCSRFSATPYWLKPGHSLARRPSGRGYMTGVKATRSVLCRRAGCSWLPVPMCSVTASKLR